jgi:hypothetical protein
MELFFVKGTKIYSNIFVIESSTFNIVVCVLNCNIYEFILLYVNAKKIL